VDYESLMLLGRDLAHLLEGHDPALFHDVGHEGLLDRHRRHVALTTRPGVPAIGPYLMRRIADARTMMAGCLALRRNGRTSPGPGDVRLHDLDGPALWSLCRTLADSVRRKIYRPGPEAKRRVPKDGKPGQFRELTLQSTQDRIVGKAAALILGPVVDPLFSPFSFGFRPGRGPLSALGTALALVESGRPWVVSADIAKAFDRVPVGRFLDACRRHFPPDAVEFIALISHTGKRRGIRQGSPASPFFFNLFADHHLDRPWKSRHPHLPLIRYADDLLLACRTGEEAASAYGCLALLARSAGVPLKESAADAIHDLRDGRPLDWLGYLLRFDGDRLTVRIGVKAWTRLSGRLAKAHLLPAPPLVARQIVQGWLNYLGPAFASEDRPAVLRTLRQTAATFAFEELPAPTALEECWAAAADRWHTESRQQRQLLAHRIHLTAQTGDSFTKEVR
jgi:hypothetical protein